jgi:hypothetical protein
MEEKIKYIEKLLRHDSAWKGHGLLAMKLVESFNPKVIVDLGVDYGFSTFCLGYPKIGKVYGIDWFLGDDHAGLRETYSLVKLLHEDLEKEFGPLDIKFIKSDFAEAAKTWNKKIDILHIDGFHSYEAVKTDYENWVGFCNKDALILFHDVESFPETVGKFFNELSGYKLINPGSAGLGILTKSEEKFNTMLNF